MYVQQRPGREGGRAGRGAGCGEIESRSSEIRVASVFLSPAQEPLQQHVYSRRAEMTQSRDCATRRFRAGAPEGKPRSTPQLLNKHYKFFQGTLLRRISSINRP